MVEYIIKRGSSSRTYLVCVIVYGTTYNIVPEIVGFSRAKMIVDWLNSCTLDTPIESSVKENDNDPC